MRDFSDALARAERRLGEAGTYLDADGLRKRQAELEVEVGRPDLWDNIDVGQKVTREYNQVSGDLALLDGLALRLSDAKEFYELGREEADDSVEAEVAEAIVALDTELDRLELRSLSATPSVRSTPRTAARTPRTGPR
jgi:peptide chain release factor 2